MIQKEENIEKLKSVKRSLVSAHGEIERVCCFMEDLLTTEYEQAQNKAYGCICRTLGILEEQIASVSNLLNNLK